MKDKRKKRRNEIISDLPAAERSLMDELEKDYAKHGRAAIVALRKADPCRYVEIMFEITMFTLREQDQARARRRMVRDAKTKAEAGQSRSRLGRS